MDIDAILEAFQDFEKRGKKETCPALEQFLCHVAKTGQPMQNGPEKEIEVVVVLGAQKVDCQEIKMLTHFMNGRIPWSQFKTYFLFKLDKVMEDFHASTPEERDSHNPNVEYIPFEEMKKRILKIVDGYNGIPFTIQRLCELLTDPKRNYTGTDKFLRGLEKNVMVVSYLHPISEKNGTSTMNRMNGVMFLGNSSLYSESSRNVNGPSLSKTLNRPKLSSSSLSTNGLPECPASKDPDGITETEEHHSSETPPSEDEAKPKHGIKHKHREEDEESDCDKQEAKKRKTGEYDDEKEREENESSCHKEPESSSDTPESEEDTCGQECSSETYHDTPCKSDSHGESSTPSEPPEREGESNDAGAAASVQSNISVDQSEQATPSETHSTSEQDSALCNSSSSSDAEGLPSEKASSSNSPELPTEGGAETSDSAETTLELGEGN